MYPCPGGCGRSNDTGSWCGSCSWVARVPFGFGDEEERAKLAKEWPFEWSKPVRGWYGS